MEILELRINPVSFGYALDLGSSLNDQGAVVAIDSAGNLYATGQFQGSVDFDPGPGTFSLTSAGSYDVFVAKYTAAGTLVWACQFAGAGWNTGNGIAVDASGNVFVTGFMSGRVDYDPGPGTFNLNTLGIFDVFVCALDTAGAFVWARNMGGGGGNDGGTGIAVDVTGNVYTVGRFESTGDFDPGAGTFNLTSSGLTDVFVSKLDSAGNFVWARRIGGVATERGDGIALDSAGDIYTTGRFGNTVDFDPGAGTFTLNSSGMDDIFISKLNSAGTFVWARSFGGINSDAGNGIATDSAGNVYTTGYFQGAGDFDPGAGLHSQRRRCGRCLCFQA